MKRNFQSTLVNLQDDPRFAEFLKTGDEASLAPSDRLALLMIKVHDRPLSTDDIEILLKYVAASDIKIATDALMLLTGMEDAVLSRLVALYDQLLPDIQRPLIVLLSGAESEVASRFLFSQLEHATTESDVDFITLCLSKSVHHIFTIVFFTFPTASHLYRARLQKLLKKMGIGYAKPFLVALPSIPDIEFFEAAYGKEAIQDIQRGRR